MFTDLTETELVIILSVTCLPLFACIYESIKDILHDKFN